MCTSEVVPPLQSLMGILNQVQGEEGAEGETEATVTCTAPDGCWGKKTIFEIVVN